MTQAQLGGLAGVTGLPGVRRVRAGSHCQGYGPGAVC